MEWLNTNYVEELRRLGYFAEHDMEDHESPSKEMLKRAMREYQAANLEKIDDAGFDIYGGARMIVADGRVGPATAKILTNHQMCDCYPPDDRALEVDAGITGPWGPCHKTAINFSVDTKGKAGLPQPEWLEDIWDEVEDNVLKAGLSVGVRFRRVPFDHPTEIENIRVTFVSHRPGWIGLAQYPRPYGTCNIQVFCKLNLRYRPSSNRNTLISQWSRLFGHEMLGHNCDIQHHNQVKGDMMNSVIAWGEWQGLGDFPSTRTLVDKYGGELEEDEEDEPIDTGRHIINLDESVDWRKVQVNIENEPKSPFILTQEPIV